jgi:hypothetical protein
LLLNGAIRTERNVWRSTMNAMLAVGSLKHQNQRQSFCKSQTETKRRALRRKVAEMGPPLSNQGQTDQTRSVGRIRSVCRDARTAADSNYRSGLLQLDMTEATDVDDDALARVG